MAAADNSHANFAGAGAEEVVAIIQKVDNGAGIEEQNETRVQTITFGKTQLQKHDDDDDVDADDDTRFSKFFTAALEPTALLGKWDDDLCVNLLPRHISFL